jgi:hypothetical protein
MTVRRLDTSIQSDDFREFSFELLNKKDFLPDVYHDLPRLIDKYQKVMSECCQPWGVVNQKNKLGAVFFVGDIVPDHEGVFYLWCWDKGCYTHSVHRFVRDYIEACMTENGLVRIVCRTPDEKGLGRVLEHCGFKLEGRFARGWKSGGRSSVLFQYRKF